MKILPSCPNFLKFPPILNAISLVLRRESFSATTLPLKALMPAARAFENIAPSCPIAPIVRIKGPIARRAIMITPTIFLV